MATLPRPPPPHQPGPPGAMAELLRIAGAVLDREAAREAEIRVRDPLPEAASAGALWTLSWIDTAGQFVSRAYRDADFAQLQNAARQQRRATSRSVVAPRPGFDYTGSHTERLRTLGQELDQEGARLRWLRTVGRGIQVREQTQAGETRHYYGFDELHKLNWERQFDRQPPAPPRSGCLLWFLRRREGA